MRIAPAISGPGLKWTDPIEGKSNIISTIDGLLKINVAGLARINKQGNIIVATLKTNYPVRKGQIIAATRIIPLTILKSKIERIEKLARSGQTVLRVLAYRNLNVGAVVTGTELYKGLIPDEFDKYVGRKVHRYGSNVKKNPGAR